MQIFFGWWEWVVTHTVGSGESVGSAPEFLPSHPPSYIYSCSLLYILLSYSTPYSYHTNPHYEPCQISCPQGHHRGFPPAGPLHFSGRCSQDRRPCRYSGFRCRRSHRTLKSHRTFSQAGRGSAVCRRIVDSEMQIRSLSATFTFQHNQVANLVNNSQTVRPTTRCQNPRLRRH